MSKPIWRYSVSVGMSGYMPNTTSGPYSGTTRRDLVDLIREQFRLYADGENDPPHSALMRQVRVRNLWHHIARHGSSSAHFSIDIGNSEQICFSGLTEEEFSQQEAEQD